MIYSSIIFATFAWGSFAKSVLNNLENYSFENYVEDFNIKLNENEIEMRRKLFYEGICYLIFLLIKL
jgi:hypothetical protein